MVCCGGDNNAEKDKDREINNFLNKSRKKDKARVKLLLLGAGESGKSTIFKQMKILYGTPASTEDRATYTQVIYNNTTSAMKMILNKAQEWGMDSAIGDQKAIETVLGLPENSPVDSTVGNAIKTLWADSIIQQVWARRVEFQVVDSMQFFFNEIDRIMADDYLATEQDYLYTRVRTSGVVTNSYDISGVTFEMYDVGGQRNERRKWIHCFSDVTAVIFVAALSEYDQVLFEHTETNRVTEALNLFEEIVRHDCFQKSAVMLFLNKYDLFLDKLKNKPVENESLWNDFKPSGNEKTYAKEAEDYFTEKFVKISKSREAGGQAVYVRTTTATDTRNIKFVFESCKDIILEQNIDDSGF